MMGGVSKSHARANRVSKAAILRPPKRSRSTIANFRRRLRTPSKVPASGQIVFRYGSSQILR